MNKNFLIFWKEADSSIQIRSLLHLCYSLNISIRCLSVEKEEGELKKKKRGGVGVGFLTKQRFGSQVTWMPSFNLKWALNQTTEVGNNHHVYMKIATTNLYK